MMLQQEKPEDFVISTGRMETVRKFIEICAQKLGWKENKKFEVEISKLIKEKSFI